MKTRPVALTVAGSDSGAGAGIQADLKTFAAHGVYGTSAITLVTAQNTLGVQAVHHLPPELVRAQLRSVLHDFPVAVVKTGALGSAATVRVVAETLRATGLPLVVDPVLVSTSGSRLLAQDALTVLREELLPLATLVTPNRAEAEVLLGLPEGALMEAAALQALAWRALPFPLLVTGTHACGEVVSDHLYAPDHRVITARQQHTRHTHGTGCTLASAVAANLARGTALPEAVLHAHAYVQRAMRASPGLGGGHGPLGHVPA
ncbi:bifunctional hydroxymethylpyrimidine kinase/phosphomethylpyrimidine kinase [Deinococcus peraridilitoris]|uniref:hydroxymethylpyrimidine kinase n=1 Tax=Deinococcus peraridilitoris (strain DSM 19664 / LMG 22246 / CIP 109416 / KR-200) TaxID=937777 RepID=K9ZVZ5_DEIPD|nr:bifunctional hydroxymethylpyrimidine kinase/phosphomethylpyrimidine kinase [Deinococcus peraridilitoris]AFZ65808.1 phosphomethylpyrimidine kinase [Deinococcus peraridilitoris DSM 19664]